MESLFTAVNLLDRFQSRDNLAADKLLLLGTVALIVAGKYCTVRMSKKKWIVDAQTITGFAYTLAEIQVLELEMLHCIPGQIKMPNTIIFLDLTLPADADMQVRCLTCYLAELTLYEQQFLSYPPLHICATCVMLARQLLGMQTSTEERIQANDGTPGPAYTGLSFSLANYSLSFSLPLSRSPSLSFCLHFPPSFPLSFSTMWICIAYGMDTICWFDKFSSLF